MRNIDSKTFVRSDSNIARLPLGIEFCNTFGGIADNKCSFRAFPLLTPEHSRRSGRYPFRLVHRRAFPARPRFHTRRSAMTPSPPRGPARKPLTQSGHAARRHRVIGPVSFRAASARGMPITVHANVRGSTKKEQVISCAGCGRRIETSSLMSGAQIASVNELTDTGQAGASAMANSNGSNTKIGNAIRAW
jgi:hypothetical protein